MVRRSRRTFQSVAPLPRASSRAGETCSAVFHDSPSRKRRLQEARPGLGRHMRDARCMRQGISPATRMREQPRRQDVNRIAQRQVGSDTPPIATPPHRAARSATPERRAKFAVCVHFILPSVELKQRVNITKSSQIGAEWVSFERRLVVTI